MISGETKRRGVESVQEVLKEETEEGRGFIRNTDTTKENGGKWNGMRRGAARRYFVDLKSKEERTLKNQRLL